MTAFKATTGVSEAYHQQACKFCFIAVIPSQTYGNVWWSSPLLLMPIGLQWDCCDDTRFTSMAKMSFTDPRGGLNPHASNETMQEIIKLVI